MKVVNLVRERGNLLNSDIPEWLQEFRENLVDDEVPDRGGSHASSSHEVSLEPTTKRREDFGKHSVYTHFLKYRNCDICQRTKITRAPCRRRNGGAVPRAENFGDSITADHKVLSEGCESRNNHRYAVVVQDWATQWIQAYSCKTKTSQETQKSLQKFLESTRKPKVIHTDNSIGFGRACEDFSWNHFTSTRYHSKRNGIAERAVRMIKEGTSAVLLQSDLDEKWWADSMECHFYLRNIQDLLSDGKTPYERRFGEPFKGPIIPFGSMVEYHPCSAKDLSRLHQFGKKVSPGIFLGYVLYAERFWKGDKMVMEQSFCLEEIRFWEHPFNQGQPGSRRRTRKSSRRITTSRLIDEWWWSKKWFLVHTWELHLPLRHIDVTRATSTTLNVIFERRIDDYWDLSDSWTGFTRFTVLDEKAPDGKTWSGERLTKKQTTSRPDYLWPEIWKDMSEAPQLKE